MGRVSVWFLNSTYGIWTPVWCSMQLRYYFILCWNWDLIPRRKKKKELAFYYFIFYLISASQQHNHEEVFLWKVRGKKWKMWRTILFLINWYLRGYWLIWKKLKSIKSLNIILNRFICNLNLKSKGREVELSNMLHVNEDFIK